MKRAAVGVCLVIFFNHAISQTDNTAGQMIEGGKLVVELIKALKGKKEISKDDDCKSGHADLCTVNESTEKIIVTLFHRGINEKRELVIQPSMKECCLQLTAGVWTYDLKIGSNKESIRKGDIMLESCENVSMRIKT